MKRFLFFEGRCATLCSPRLSLGVNDVTTEIHLHGAATMVALAALTLNSLAQPPGRNGGGPGGGPGGFFGRGGGPGGPGGFGGSLLMLASNPAVQADIYMKVKDKQKAQIKNLNDKFAQQSRASGADGRRPKRPRQGSGS